MNESLVNEIPEIMQWKVIHKDQAVLTLWPGIVVYEKDREDLMQFFSNVFDITPTIVGCVVTLPDKDELGRNVPDTGGRHDLFFYVNANDVTKFAIQRLSYGMRWWEDIFFNDGQDIYPTDFLATYPISLEPMS